MSEPIYFSVVLPPSEYEDDEFRKREVFVKIARDGIVYSMERYDQPMNCTILEGLEAELGDTAIASGVDHGQEKRREFDEVTGRQKIGDLETSKSFGPVEAVLILDLWCPAGRLGIRTSKEPPDGLKDFQDEEAMRKLEE